MKNLRVIYILRWRQIKRFFRQKARLIWTICQPLIMLFALSAWFSGIFEAAGQENYMSFLAAGIIAINTMMGSLSSWIDIIRDKEFWFIKEYLVSPNRRIYIMIWRTLWWATTWFLQWLMLLVIMLLFWWIDSPGIWWLIVAILFMIWVSVIFAALWIIIASLIPDFQWFQLINNFLIMPLMMLSWSMYPLDTAATWLQRVARFDPLAYWVDWMRRALAWNSFFWMWMTVGVLLALMLIFTIIWWYTFSRMKADS